MYGQEFVIKPADVDESPLDNESPGDYVSRLAELKARAVSESFDESVIIIAADTSVADGNMPLGKPANEIESRQMLEQLRNRTHQVYTGLAIIDKKKNKIHIELACTDVPMRDYTDDEISEYIATGDPFDKAGGYAIQNPGFHPVNQLSGCYANVVGLPLCHLTRSMTALDLGKKTDIPILCQQRLDYSCDVYERVLKGKL